MNTKFKAGQTYKTKGGYEAHISDEFEGRFYGRMKTDAHTRWFAESWDLDGSSAVGSYGLVPNVKTIWCNVYHEDGSVWLGIPYDTPEESDLMRDNSHLYVKTITLEVPV